MQALKPHPTLFAPMEGITDAVYRELILQEYGAAWDFVATDFLRLPTSGLYPARKFREHIGLNTLQQKSFLDKTIFQILASKNSLIEESLPHVEDLGVKWLDLNLGCPSRTVNSHGGGSILLERPQELLNVVARIRKSWKSFFSVKIRLGYNDEDLFLSNLKLFEDLGVDLVTIHGRLRKDLYKGKARWGPIARAQEHIAIPVIGNGDIWTHLDIKEIYRQTKCFGIMIARGATKNPWGLGKTLTPEERLAHIQKYYEHLYHYYQKAGKEESIILRRIKALSRYLFEDVPDGAQLQKNILRSSTLENIFARL